MKVFTFNHTRRGTYLDSISKTAGTNNNGVFESTEKGIAWKGDLNNGNIVAPSSLNTLIGDLENDFTLNVWFKLKNTDGQQQIIGHTATNRFAIEFYVSTIRAGEQGGDEESGVVYPNIWYHLIVTNTGHNTPGSDDISIFIDNVEQIGNLSPSVFTATVATRIGSSSGITAEFSGHIGKIEGYNEVLSAKKRAELYQEFTDAGAILETNYPEYDLLMQKPMDLSRFQNDGLVAAYNMIADNETLVDISGNGNNGTITGALQTAEGMRFDGVDDYVQLTNTETYTTGTGDCTFLFRYKKNNPGTAGVLIGGVNAGRNLIEITAGGQLQLETNTNGDLATSSDYTDDALVHSTAVICNNGTVSMYQDGVALTMADASVTDDMGIKYIGALQGVSRHFSGEIYDIRTFNYAFTEAEAIAYHNKFARQPYLVETFMDEGVGTGLPTHWTKGTGDYEVRELAAQDAVLKHLDVGVKYLQCTSAGTLAIPSNAAYGTYEFDLYKGADANIVSVGFISQKIGVRTLGANGYQLEFSGGEALQLNEYPLTNFSTALSYISINTWYRIKITRTKDGEFYTYIKGGAFGSQYVLVSVTGGSGTNPVTDNTYTSSEYLVLDFDNGDRIANIRILSGVVQ